MTNFNTISPQPMQSIIKPQAQQANLHFGSGAPPFDVDDTDTFQKVELSLLEKREVASNVALGFGVMAEVLDYPLTTISLVPTKYSLGHTEREKLTDLTAMEKDVFSEEDDLKRILLDLGGIAGETAESGELNLTPGGAASFAQAEKQVNEMTQSGFLQYTDSNADPKDIAEKVMNNAQQKAIQILQLVPQTARTQIIDAALEAVTLEGDDAKNFIKNTLGQNFDWEPLKAIAQEFINNPTGK